MSDAQRRRSFAATALLLSASGLQASAAFVVREGNLDGTQAISDTSSAWRTFSCMVPFTPPNSGPLLMLYGGTNDTKAKDPLAVVKSSSGITGISIFDINTNQWHTPNTSNAPSRGPILPGCGASPGSIWAYDPQYGQPDKSSTTISLLDSVYGSWSTPSQQGQLPVTRFGAAFAYASSTQKVYMHGGIPLNGDSNTAGSPPGIANNLDVLSPSTLSWDYASNGLGRKYHTLCYLSSIDSLVAFGGSDQNKESYNDITVYAVKNNAWNIHVVPTGPPPAERLLHSAVCTEDTMYVFGGLNGINNVPSDSVVWMLTAKSATDFTWSKAPISASNHTLGPAPRAGHAAALYNNSMYVYGGIGSSTQDGTMYKLDLSSWEWSRITADGVEAKGKSSGNTSTAVLIAAVISSVLGVITIGIAATVIFRLNRRRQLRAGFLKRGERRNADAQSDSSSERSSGDLAYQERGSNEANGGASAEKTTDYSPLYKEAAPDLREEYHQASPQDTAAHTYLPPPHTNAALDGSISSLLPPTSASSDGPLMCGEKDSSAENTSGERAETTPGTPTPMTTCGSITTESGLLGDLPKRTNQTSSGGRGTGLLNSMRTHARSLSTRIASSARSSATFSDGGGTTVRSHHTATAGGRSSEHRREPTIIDRQTAVNMYGPDHQRLENEYRQAEAINQILLSGQPIPAWLRDAVSQAETNGSSAPSGAELYMVREEGEEDEGALPRPKRSQTFKVANNA
ncbi:galactose oxidase [Martensiomyces pterosporus]|nr:galactose oxidase [Martensiomyces pterosporus]